MAMTDRTHDKSTSDILSEGGRQSGVSTWLNILRAKLGFAVPQSVRDALEGALKTDASTSFTDTERKMLERLLRFGSSRVVELMVPRAEITALVALPRCMMSSTAIAGIELANTAGMSPASVSGVPREAQRCSP